MDAHTLLASGPEAYFPFAKEIVEGNATDISCGSHPYRDERCQHFDTWAARNLAVLGAILPASLLEAVKNDHVNPQQAQDIHELVEKYLFADSIQQTANYYALMTTARTALAQELMTATDRYLREGAAIAERVAQNGICVVLVRPEILYLRDVVCRFLESNGYEVLSRTHVALTAEQYLVLYNHVFNDPVKESHVRRRAFGYVHQTCELVLIRRRVRPEEGIAELNARLKGSVGSADIGTLRGGIGFCEARVNYADTSPLVRTALDPYKGYRVMDESTRHLPEEKRFVANLHSVHIPNAYELIKDICVLCDRETLKNI